MNLSLTFPSPVEEISYEGHSFYLKRDDLIHSDFSGNKARKFHYYLLHDFPEVKKLISYGSNQSNAMYSLSVLAKMKGWEFDYSVDHIPDYLRENPQGNYKGALENGMRISTPRAFVPSVGHVEDTKSILFIEEGGRQKEAEVGIRILANEIIEWKKERKIKDLNIFLPSGTGTTALFLQKALSTSPTEGTNALGVLNVPDQRDKCPWGAQRARPKGQMPLGCSTLKVFTTPCVGGSDYLTKQFAMLEDDEKYHPTILNLEKKYHFGKLYRDYYKIWLKLRQQTGVEFDLLYDPKGWMTMMANPEIFSEPTLYIHQGGLKGNESMLPRYERKYKDIKHENIV